MNYEQLLSVLNNMLTQIRVSVIEMVPNVAGALVVFLFGVLVAYLIRWLARRVINSLDRLIPSRKIRSALERIGMKRPASDVIGNLLFWIIILFVLTASTEMVGLPVVTTWLGGIALYLPRFLAAVLIGFVGVVGGVMLRDLITTASASAGITFGDVLARLVQGAVLLVSILIGIEHIGINISLLTSVMIISIGALLLGAALAFGLGARTSMSNIMASYYLRKTYRVGHRIRVGDIVGQIVQITPTAVIIDAEEGQVLVPAKVFNEVTSILILKEEV